MKTKYINLIIVASIILHLCNSCLSATSDKTLSNNRNIILVDPEDVGLQCANPINEIIIKKNFFSQYDSIFVDGDVRIIKVVDRENPDSIRVVPVKGYDTDSNNWDCLYIYTWGNVIRDGEAERSTIPLCWMNRLFVEPETTEEYRDLMIEIEKKIMEELKKRSFFIPKYDSVHYPYYIQQEWQQLSIKNVYLNRK